MHHDFKNFLRRGGNGEYVLQQKGGRIFGRSLSLESQFPGYERLRQDFRRRLEAVSDDNARMILSALTLPDTPPLYSEDDLLPAAEIIDQVLQHWDDRLEDIYLRYQNHPQRLRPLRKNMEDRTALSFAGLINQLRQEDLGIDRYVWATRGDHKVRPAHAALNGEAFYWDHPSGEGHPGEAPNCRCLAMPIPAGAAEVILANFTLPADGVGTLSEAALRRALQQLVAKTPAGAALLAAMGTATGLRHLTQMMGDARLHRAAERLGLDVTSVEGLWAAYAFAKLSELAGVGFPGIPKTADAAQIAGQAAALYELMAPGTMLHGPHKAQADLLRFVADAWRAHEQGRLQLTPDGWAQGWVEVFPELTEDEHRLGELLGFTGAQQEAFILADPVLNDGLPAHTGHAPEADPVGNVISTPITEEAYAQILARARNEPGVASGTGKQIGADWLREGVRTGVMPIPASVAEKLEGRRFGSFDSYRRAFWKAVAEDPELLRQFDRRNISRIQNGLSPMAPPDQQVGQRGRWEIDHVEPLWADGELYESENLQIMTPQSHINKTREDMKRYSVD